MTNPHSGIVFYAPTAPSRGGRKKKFIKVDVHSNGSKSSSLAQKRNGGIKPQPLPQLVKICTLPGLLGVSRATVYRMIKAGLKTVRPTNGDQYVLREDLETFLSVRKR